ncbi:MAG TPA: hydrogenase nickel incorporation protein HypB [Geomonas sp.]|nr:hydrogenase nickel incorporation protein HypB [Geomonas sp.]
MCIDCGCPGSDQYDHGSDHHHHHGHDHGHHHDHDHEHDHDDHHDHHHDNLHSQHDGEHHDHHGHHHHDQHEHHEHHHDHGEAAGQAQRSGLKLQVETDILAKNDRMAEANRLLFRQKGLFVLNLVSSPGSGKTTILERTLKDNAGSCRFAVIEGDQQTDNDAVRIAATGVPVKQINTGAGCHLDAHMVLHATEHLDLDQLDLLMIENVGNLVCPASFDLGEHHKVVVLSVTEGEDKPLKYPQMFHAATVMLLNKVDLLPYLDFDVEKCKEMARRVSPGITIFEVSSRTGEGMNEWYAWLKGGVAGAKG